MSHRNPQRGTTLIEAMVALSVLLIGAAGMVGLHNQGVRVEGDSRRITRATAIAQDLVTQIDLWPYTDPRLANTQVGNDLSLGDPTFAIEGSADPVADGLVDYGEAGLTLGGAAWLGLPAAAVNGYERYYGVAYVDDSNGNAVPDSARVAVVVRWRSGSAWRRVVILSTKPNPAEAR